MKSKFLRAASAVVAVSIIASSAALMAGCNKVSTEENGVISADSTWYNCKKIHLEIPYEREDVEMISVFSPVVCGDYIYAIICAHRNMAKVQAEKGNNISYTDFNINDVVKYDLDGKYIGKVKLDNTSDYSFIQITKLNVQNGKIKASGMASGVDSYPYYLIDTDTDEAEFHDFQCKVSDTSYITESLDVGDYSCFVVEDTLTNGSSYKISVVKNDEVINTIDLNKAITKPFDSIYKFLVKDEDTLVITCRGKESFTAEITVSTGEVEVMENNLNTSNYHFMPSQDGSYYAIDYSGIYAIDDELVPESILDFSDANVNISSLFGGEVVYADDSKVVAYTYDASDPEWFDAYAYVFDKVEKNPNAGKKILDVYSLSGALSYAEAESIVKFNDSNEDFYAKVSFANVLDSYDDDDELMNSISEDLMIDLINGDGPDVLLNAQGFSQFNNSDFFVDMSQFMSGADGIDSSKYFSNIFEASATDDGAIYQLPVSFGVNGIMCCKDAVDSGKSGFTYEEFIDFVSEDCYGKNPISGSQSDFIINSLKNGVIPYLTDGKVDFDSVEFRMAAQYAKENIFEELVVDEEETIDLMNTTDNRLPNQPMEVKETTNKYYVFDTLCFDDKVGIYGYPSIDAKGPTATILSSVAISAAIDEDAQKASWDFAKTLISEEIQLEETYGMPVNRAAFETLTNNASEKITEEYYRLKSLDYYTEALIHSIGYGVVDESVCDDLVGLIDTIDSITSLDSALIPILNEELAAYFAGQKPIDDVISIINNRAQTVINERGGK